MTTDKEMLKRLGARQVILTPIKVERIIGPELGVTYCSATDVWTPHQPMIETRVVLVHFRQTRWLRMWDADLYDCKGHWLALFPLFFTRKGVEKAVRRWLKETPRDRALCEEAQLRAMKMAFGLDGQVMT